MDAQQANNDKDAVWRASDDGIRVRKADLDTRRLKTVAVPGKSFGLIGGKHAKRAMWSLEL